MRPDRELVRRTPDNPSRLITEEVTRIAKEALAEDEYDLRPEMVQAYSKLNDDRLRESDTAAADSAGDAIDKLAAFGVSWWQK